MSKPKKTPVKLEVEGEVSQSTLCFRLSGATAELEDGRSVEVSPTLGMTGVVIIVTNPDKTWRTYFLSAHALATAALRQEDQLGAMIEGDAAAQAGSEAKA